MPMWIRNLKARLDDRPVIILHGNVRDRYIDENGRVYDNLTELLREVAREVPLSFSELVFYDSVKNEWRVGDADKAPPRRQQASGDRELDDATEFRREVTEKKDPPARVLARWLEELSVPDQSRLAVLFYLDKLVAYKASYGKDEEELLLRLEKLIENITPNHRLVLVALQDGMVPIELYTNSPKTALLSIPFPDKADRMAYLKHRLGDEQPHLELIADLTDGLFLRDLDNVVTAVSGHPELTTRDVRRVVNRYRIGEQADHWGALSIERLNGAARWFAEGEGIKGQEEAIRKVVDMLCLARAGLSGVASGTTSKPRGVLFFAGPTGVGKTFMAKKLAKFLFGTEEAFLRFDMSEFKEEHTVSKLIGSPPGYVGSERGGTLTNAVRERPFAVILFDEVEKAHPKIMDIFLQILGEGRLTDSRGQTVFFTETLIIFTSNLGTRTTDSRGIAAREREEMDAILGDQNLEHEGKKSAVRKHFTRAVERFFMFEISRPELLNRIGNNIVPFNYIHTLEVQMDIVRSHLRRIQEDFEDKHRSAGHRLVFDDSVAQWLVQKYSDRISMFGGLGITNAIEDEVMMPLARAALRAEFGEQQQISFHVSSEDGHGISVEQE